MYLGMKLCWSHLRVLQFVLILWPCLKFGVFGFPRQPSVARHWENVQRIILTQSTLSQWDIICVTHC